MGNALREPTTAAEVLERARSAREWRQRMDSRPVSLVSIVRSTKMLEPPIEKIIEPIMEPQPDIVRTEIDPQTQTIVSAAEYVIHCVVHDPICLEDALSSLLSAIERKQKITVLMILKSVAKRYGHTIDELRSDRRHEPLVRSRQMAMYLARELTANSFTEIGRRMGGRDHTTIIHGYKKMVGLISASYELQEEVAYLKAELRVEGGMHAKEIFSGYSQPSIDG